MMMAVTNAMNKRCRNMTNKDRFLTDLDRILDILFSLELQDRAREKGEFNSEVDKEIGE